MKLAARLKLLRQALVFQNLDGFVVSQRENITYLSGLHQLHPTNREALLLVTHHQAILYHSIFLSPPRPAEDMTIQNLPMDTAHLPDKIFPEIFSACPRLGIEATDYTVSELNKLHALLPQITIVPTDNLIYSLRLTKDAAEIQAITKSCRIVTKLMSWAHTSLIPGITEMGFSRQLEMKAYDLGADGLAFPPIVAFGPHTASPHHESGSTRLTSGPVLLDLGVFYQGYASDMTRTFWFGSPTPPQFKEIEMVVNQAYHAALDHVLTHFPHSKILTVDNASPHTAYDILHTSLHAADLDHAARSVIDAAGFGKYFIHTTGHGLGLEIHEPPSINSHNPMQLQPGMVITLEPGIYLPRTFGYRFENTLMLK